MAYREVRRGHKLLFKFDPDTDTVEIVVRGKTFTIPLGNYRPQGHRTREQEQRETAKA